MGMDKCGSNNCEYLTEFGYCMLSACVNPQKRGRVTVTNYTTPIPNRTRTITCPCCGNSITIEQENI